MEIKIIYNFLDILFLLTFISISILYLIASIYIKYNFSENAEKINIFNKSILKYYIVSILWIVIKYIYIGR
jgi:hypothetical protein